MKRLVFGALWATGLALCLFADGRAQEPAQKASTTDPRVGLKAGFHDAGEAAMNMVKIASLPKPQGFFDPKSPAGPVTPPEKPDEDKPPAENASGSSAPPAESGQKADNGSNPPASPEKGGAPATPPAPRGGGLGFANSDLAFSKNHVVMGNFHGFTTYDVDS